jgi:NtrC-family two-component system sensor histidine kinase KinB
MNQRQRSLVAIVAAGAVLALLVGLTVAQPPGREALLPGALFLLLLVFTHTFGVPLAGGRASLLPTTTVAAYLVLGLVPAGWVAFLGALLHGAVRYRWAEALSERPSSSRGTAAIIAIVNAVLQTASILAAGAVYQGRGGVTPYTGAAGREGWALLPLALTYLGMNLLLAGLYLALQSRERLRLYLRSLYQVLLFEAWPLIFAPLMALIYNRLGLFQFVLMALALVVASLVTRNLSLARQRLERRVAELDSLQAVGQVLSASLDLEAILTAVHAEVSRLMPARNFYAALYDPATDEVSFPLAVESGERVRWRSRRTGHGLTEQVLRTRQPLLIRDDYEATLARLGIESIGRPACSWLGVPLLAGDEALGVLAVQAYTTSLAYDLSHQEVLTTIAAQAAVAIQNARLYARTDEALARRVQELDSILRTSREGILLLDPEGRVLAANRALAEFLGLAQLELLAAPLDAAPAGDEPGLLDLIGYTPEALAADREALAGGEIDVQRQEIVLRGPPERPAERTLTPVRDREGTIRGWLFVFRDLSEERELARLRDELTHMLIHDLRSPLSVLISGLDLMRLELADGRVEGFSQILDLAEQSSDQVLRLINTLLDISRLESGQMVIAPEAVAARSLLEKVAAQLSPLAITAHIAVEIEAAPDLPPLHVDAELVRRAVHNLVDNALKFTPDGGQVRLWARPDPARPGFQLIGVGDSGPGIPPEAWPRLFAKFQQVGQAQGRRRGTGLGLPFCKLVAQAHGGDIWVESEVGAGSTFVLRLPVEP